MAKFCGKCGQPIEFCTCPKPRDGGGAGSGGGFSFAGRSFSVGAKIGSFTLGEGECLVRTYDIAKHLIGHGYIKLCITNKRAILLTENRGLLNTHNTTYYDETNLDKVQGISAGLDGRFSAFGIILGLFFIFLAIAALCIRGLLYYAFGPLKVFFAIALILLGIYFIAKNTLRGPNA